MIKNRWSKTIFLITGKFKKISTLKSKLKNSLLYKHKVLILRIPSADVDIDEVLHVIRKFCKKNNIPLILNIPDKFKYKADGYHLQASELNKKLSISTNKILGAS